MEKNEAYGNNTGVPSSFGGFNYSSMNNLSATPYNTNNYTNLLVGNPNHINPYHNFPPYNTTPTLTPTPPTTLSPNNNFPLCPNITDTNAIAPFPGALNNHTVQNYENTYNTMQLVNSAPQPFAIGVNQQTHDAVQINMGVNAADHLGSLVFSDGENTINGHLSKKKRNVISRHKRSSFRPFDQFDFTQHVQPPPQPQVQAQARLRRVRADDSKLRFLFQKQLQNSDVNNLKRMVIPKKPAEAFLPHLSERSGIRIAMIEIDGSEIWHFSYRFWPNNKSRMYILENTGEFVNKHKLKTGDFITVYEDTESQNYVIEASKPKCNNVVYKPKPRKIRNHSKKDKAETDKDTPPTVAHNVAPSLEAGKGLPTAAKTEPSVDHTTVDNYMPVPNNGFEAGVIIDNVVNFPNPVDNSSSLIYSDINYPNDYSFMWERRTSSQPVPTFQNLSYDEILKGM
ncbi:hypothetical protein ACET3Z_022260 [Daucus carota]